MQKNKSGQNNKSGTLYVVATPIGNLKDMSLRAIDILKEVNLIAAEDTRHAAPLLKHYSIDKPTISLHEFNEKERLKTIITYLEQGDAIALITDAGTPLVSDPGFLLIREAKNCGISVVPIPGACAAVAALSVAGLPSDKFIFEGFLPVKQVARENRLKLLRHETRTMIFYEAPHRLLSVLQSMMNTFGAARKAVVARELTKMHETVMAANIGELLNHFLTHTNEVRGEIVILVEGIEEEILATKEVVPEAVLTTLLKELPLKQAVSLTSEITGERKNVLYEMALRKKTDTVS